MSVEVGQVIEGKYRIVRLIGEGGMGAVYEGENVRIHRRVAIKVLHAAFTNNTDVVQRFEREAQAAGRIGNDHILEVLDLGTLQDGSCFMVMEFLDGDPLNKRIQGRGRLTPRELAPLGKQVLEGLGAAHGAGIIHRDLKPDNIFILKEKAGKADYVKIIDFGISKFQPLAGDGMKMTRTGAVMGTPYYMSPEQASGSREADARSDLYAIGVIFYEAVTGHVPFDAPTFNQLLFKIVLSEPPPPRSIVPDLDPAFESIILKAMARDVSSAFRRPRSSRARSRPGNRPESACRSRRRGEPSMGSRGLASSMASSPELRASSLGTGSNPGVRAGTGAGQLVGVATGRRSSRSGSRWCDGHARELGDVAAGRRHGRRRRAVRRGTRKKERAADAARRCRDAGRAGGGGRDRDCAKAGGDEQTPPVDPAASSVLVPTSETTEPSDRGDDHSTAPNGRTSCEQCREAAALRRRSGRQAGGEREYQAFAALAARAARQASPHEARKEAARRLRLLSRGASGPSDVRGQGPEPGRSAAPIYSVLASLEPL